MKFGLISDIHLTKKPYRLISALRMLHDIDILLIAGDLVDRGVTQQYELLANIFNTHLPGIPIITVSGNHDIPQNNTIPYEKFVHNISERLTGKYVVEDDGSGAYLIKISKNTDLIGLNPLYYQKLFHFPNKGEQLAFAEKILNDSTCKKHIILCHPPLIAHNPQRDANRQPYLPKEQDARLQKIVDAHSGILFLSGHTHSFPDIENDELHGNIYINDGSLCPTQKAGADDKTYHGNVIQFELDEQISDIQIQHLGKI